MVGRFFYLVISLYIKGEVLVRSLRSLTIRPLSLNVSSVSLVASNFELLLSTELVNSATIRWISPHMNKSSTDENKDMNQKSDSWEQYLCRLSRGGCNCFEFEAFRFDRHTKHWATTRTITTTTTATRMELLISHYHWDILYPH